MNGLGSTAFLTGATGAARGVLAGPGVAENRGDRRRGSNRGDLLSWSILPRDHCLVLASVRLCEMGQCWVYGAQADWTTLSCAGESLWVI